MKCFTKKKGGGGVGLQGGNQNMLNKPEEGYFPLKIYK